MISLVFHVRCRIIILHGDMLTRQLGTQYSDNDTVSADLLPTHTDQLVMTRKLVLSRLCRCLHILLLSLPLAFKKLEYLNWRKDINHFHPIYGQCTILLHIYWPICSCCCYLNDEDDIWLEEIIHGFCYHLVTSWTSCYLNTIYTLFSKLFLDSTTDMHQWLMRSWKSIERIICWSTRWSQPSIFTLQYQYQNIWRKNLK